VLGNSCVVIAALSLLLNAGPSAAQGSFFDNIFGQDGTSDRSRYGRSGYDREDSGDEDRTIRRRSPEPDNGGTREGGARPSIAPQAPPIVAFNQDYPINSIVIDVGGRRLYYVLPDGRAYEYAISVGREGFNWTGTETVSRKQEWPDWHPPAEMRERDRSLPVKMTGGLKNPLGAMALYLGDTLYRIHGTNDAKSIGRAASSGCFRMLNANVLHLASIADVGTQVVVVASLPAQARISEAPTAAQQPPPTAAQPSGAWSPRPRPEERRPDGASDYRTLREQLLRRD
jgi:lipoprotein-anchoring transpeptidase ErfK/SrfK